jgi:transposase
VPLDEDTRNLVVALAARGQSQRDIALEVGVSRKAVRRALVAVVRQRDEGHSALPLPKQKRPSTLDAFDGFILEQLDKFPDITAVRLLEELKKEDFDGGYTIVKERLRVLRPKPKRTFVERFETAPGVQGQQDWSPYTVPFVEEGQERVSCFSFILGFSRRQFIAFCDSEDLVTLERRHIDAAERFQGLPKEILYDNQKAVVLRREAQRAIYNPRFLAFASHYGFRPRALPPRRPDLKGKVEAPFKYVEGNCLNARTFKNRAELDAHALWWMDNISDTHKHDTTGERPIDRFAREKDALLALPTRPFDTAEVRYCVVSIEGHVLWNTTPYSVPYVHVLDLVVVRVTEREVFVYESRELREIARHERAPDGHRKPVVIPAHRPTRHARHDVDALAARLGALGNAATVFAAGVCKAQRYRGTHLADVLILVERYDADDLVRALERAVRYRAFDASVVTRILATTATTRPLPSSGDEDARRRLADADKTLAVTTRSLGEYADALGSTTARRSESTS